MGTPADLLVEHLRGKLDGQLSALESARTRAAVGLSVSGVVAGLFGPKLLTSPNNFGRAAVASLFVTGLVAIYGLVPHNLTLYAKGGEWLKWAKDNNAEDRQPALALTMAEDMAGWYGKNSKMLTRVQWALGVTFLGVAVQLVLWTFAVMLA